MFGTGNTQANQFSFGTVAQPQTSAPTFGGSFSTTTSAGTGLTANTTTTPGLNFGFGSGTGSLGTNPLSTSAAPTLNFGLTTSSAAAATSAPNFGFGAPTTAATGFGLGTSTAASTPFALGTSTQATGLGTTSFTLGATTSAAPNFSFSTTTPATSATLNPLTTTTQGSIGLSFPSLLPKTTETTAASTTLATSSAAPSFGLGGLASSTLDTKPRFEGTTTGAGSSSQKETNPKEQQLPNEILQCVENFKQYIKQQKIYSSEIARCSIKDFERVKSEIDTFHKALVTLEREIQMNRCLAEKLKYDTAKGLQHIEMAQRTQETPPGLQYENNAPLQYFRDLVDTFEKEMHTLKIQIESTDKYVRNFGKPASLTSQDLTLGMRRLHETFVALAGRLQSVHSQVESQKELYLNIRKHIFNDQTNPFETRIENTVVVPKETYIAPKVGSGPTPFNNMVISSVTLSNYQNQPPTASLTGTTMMGGFGSTAFPAVTTQSNSFYGSNTFNYSNSFQLQKPPTGIKRGKQ